MATGLLGTSLLKTYPGGDAEKIDPGAPAARLRSTTDVGGERGEELSAKANAL